MSIPMQKNRKMSILEIHRSPREQWFHSVGLVCEMLNMVRSFAMSGRRFMAAVKAAAAQVKAQRDGSFNIAIKSTGINSAESKTLNLLTGARKILSRTDTGSRDDIQIDILLKAFPLLLEIENEKTARGLCQAMRMKAIPAQQILVKQGHLGKQMLGILSGSVRLILAPEEEDNVWEQDDEKPEYQIEDDAQNWKLVPNGTIVSILKPGDLFLRTARSLHLFEQFALAATGRDLVDDEIVYVAYVDSDKYSSILTETRIAMSAQFSDSALQRRRSNLRKATRNKKGKPKLKKIFNRASQKIQLKKRQATNDMNINDVIQIKLSEKDRVRICMARLPERRTVEELEFVIEYLSKQGFWNKVAVVKEKDDLSAQKKKSDDSDSTTVDGLTPRLQREIVKNLRQLVFTKKEVVFEENSIGLHFYYILTGSVLVRKKEGTRARTLCHLPQGSCFGELALSKNGSGKRSATIVTREICEFLVLPKEMYTKSVESFQEKHLTKRLNIISSSPIFRNQHWTPQELKSICYPLEDIDHRTDDVICKQGHFATHVYFVQRGECNAFKSLRDNNNQMITMSLGRLSRGDCFGIQACSGTTYVQNKKYSISVVATTPCSILSLTRYDVFNRIQKPLKLELQHNASKHPWVNNKSLKKRLMNRERFNTMKINKNILPTKYLNRIKKAKHEQKQLLARNQRLRTSYSSNSTPSLLTRDANNSRKNKLLPQIERQPPPSRQCSRHAMKIAASQVTATRTLKKSPIATSGTESWTSIDGNSINGLLPIEKILAFAPNIMIEKIDKWVKGEKTFGNDEKSVESWVESRGSVHR